MKLEQLIEKLQQMESQVGGDAEVRVIDGDGDYGFAIHSDAIEDANSETGVGNVVYLDITTED